MEKNNPYNNNKIMTEMNTTMNSITEKFFTGCKKMENKKNLEDYKKKGLELRDLPLRGNTHISGTKFTADWISKDSEDVYVNHFDEHGNRQVFAKKYIITRTGQVYYIDNNGSPKPMSLHKQKGFFRLTLKEKDENGKKTIQPQQTFLQCTSYFADYDDWKDIMQNRGKTGEAQVDHVLQENEPDVDIQCLDLVTQAENMNRKCLDPKNTETIKKVAKSQGKPFTITIQENGKDDIVLEATSSRVGVALLEQQGITIDNKTISNRLNKQFKKEFKQNGKKVIFKHTQEFLEDQKDLPGEIWRTEDEWNLAEEIKKLFENKANGPPEAISNCGRIETNTGKVTYGSYRSNVEHRYNNALVHRLVGLAFHDYIEDDPNRQGYTSEHTVVRHINYHELIKNGIDVEKKYRIDKEGRKVLSNHIDTLEFGTQKENMQDLSNHKIHTEKQDPMNAFTVTPLRNDLPEFNRTFHSVSEFINFVKEQKINIKFDGSSVRRALNGKYTHHKRYKFTYVKSQVKSQ